jgi:hypothetical protein
LARPGWLKGVLKVFDGRFTVPVGPGYRYDVETGPLFQEVSGLEVSKTGPREPLLLGWPDSLRRMPVFGRSKRFYLNQHNRVAFEADEIDLADLGPAAAIKNAIALGTKISLGGPFTTVAQRAPIAPTEDLR